MGKEDFFILLWGYGYNWGGFYDETVGMGRRRNRENGNFPGSLARVRKRNEEPMGKEPFRFDKPFSRKLALPFQKNGVVVPVRSVSPEGPVQKIVEAVGNAGCRNFPLKQETDERLLLFVLFEKDLFFRGHSVFQTFLDEGFDDFRIPALGIRERKRRFNKAVSFLDEPDSFGD